MFIIILVFRLVNESYKKNIQRELCPRMRLIITTATVLSQKSRAHNSVTHTKKKCVLLIYTLRS